MRVTENIPTTPIAVEKSIRGDEIRVLTSGKAGKVLPVAYVPILREDRVSRGNVRLRLNMAETIHPLMNAVNVTAYAHFVPYLAFEVGGVGDGTLRRQFDGMDQFNRSYKGEEEPDGSGVKSFFGITHIAGGTYSPDHLFNVMGIHLREGDGYNQSLARCYNSIINHRRRARSKHLPLRNPGEGSVANAFWKNPNLYHIVPDFESAMIDGEIPITIADGNLGLKGISPMGDSGRPINVSGADTGVSLTEVGGGDVLTIGGGTSPNRANLTLIMNELGVNVEDATLSVFLSNIETARQTAAFAKLREQFGGIEDEHLIDLLMQGIRVPDEANKQPILLARSSTIFGYSERHAMDGDNLEKSVTTGVAELSLNFRTPPLNTGGIIMITVEIVPEQLFERMEDPFLRMSDPSQFPDFLRDYLDPEKVDVVQNRYVDTEHGTPNGTFGYAPLNHEWKRSLTRIGGKYRRPKTAGFVEDRQRFWSMEQVNPALTTDFYLVPDNLPHTVFADSTADPFEILALGNVEIVGNTVFGKVLEEDGGHYDAVSSKVDHTRINQE